MFEKVNPSHPDKLADRIAGAVVDLACRKDPNARIAVEVMIGHGFCRVTAETSVQLCDTDVFDAVKRIAGRGYEIDYVEAKQDYHLAENQRHGIRCGDNGIFKGVPVTEEQKWLAETAKKPVDVFAWSLLACVGTFTGGEIIAEKISWPSPL